MDETITLPEVVVTPDEKPKQNPLSAGLSPTVLQPGEDYDTYIARLDKLQGRSLSSATPATAGVANNPLALSADPMLNTIAHFESNGQNIKNPTSSASGPWQFLNSTWRETAPKVGIDIAKYPTAMSAPIADQERAAGQLKSERGLSPWAPYNPRLASAVGWNGSGQSSFVRDLAVPGNPLQATPSATTPTVTPRPIASTMPMLALMAAGTHQFIPVSYDPFKLESPASTDVVAPAPAGDIRRAAQQVATPQAVPSYATKIGMRDAWTKPNAGGAGMTGWDPIVQNMFSGISG